MQKCGQILEVKSKGKVRQSKTANTLAFKNGVLYLSEEVYRALDIPENAKGTLKVSWTFIAITDK